MMKLSWIVIVSIFLAIILSFFIYFDKSEFDISYAVEDCEHQSSETFEKCMQYFCSDWKENTNSFTIFLERSFFSNKGEWNEHCTQD